LCVFRAVSTEIVAIIIRQKNASMKVGHFCFTKAYAMTCPGRRYLLLFYPPMLHLIATIATIVKITIVEPEG
jgi:hypothetical protein